MPTVVFPEITWDPDLGQSVTIIRSQGHFDKGGWVNATYTVPAYGPLYPASDSDLESIPEADRTRGAMIFITETKLNQTSEVNSGVSDKIMWNGEEYRVVSVGPWVDAQYWFAILERTPGN